MLLTIISYGSILGWLLLVAYLFNPRAKHPKTAAAGIVAMMIIFGFFIGRAIAGAP